MYKPDKLDIKIILSMNENARKSFREIARELNVSLATIANRVKRLEIEGIIKGYIPVIDLELLNFNFQVIISVKISKGKLMDIQKKLSKDPHVYDVFDVTGDWDSIIVAKFKNRAGLNAFIKKVASMEFIERTNTSVILNIVKEEKRAQLNFKI